MVHAANQCLLLGGAPTDRQLSLHVESLKQRPVPAAATSTPDRTPSPDHIVAPTRHPHTGCLGLAVATPPPPPTLALSRTGLTDTHRPCLRQRTPIQGLSSARPSSGTWEEKVLDITTLRRHPYPWTNTLFSSVEPSTRSLQRHSLAINVLWFILCFLCILIDHGPPENRDQAHQG